LSLAKNPKKKKETEQNKEASKVAAGAGHIPCRAFLRGGLAAGVGRRQGEGGHGGSGPG